MHSKRNYYLLFFIAFLQGFVFYGPIATVYRQVRGISIYEIFVIESVSMVLQLIFEIPWGWFADRFGYKNTLLISYIVSFMSKLVFLKAVSFEWFLAERVLLVLSIAGISGCDTALLYNSISREDSEKVFSRYNAVSVAGFLIASFSSTFIIDISMDLTVVLTIVSYGCAALLAFFLEDIEAEAVERLKPLGSLKSALKDINNLKFIFSIALISEVSHSITVFLNQLQYKSAGIGIRYYGIILAAMQTISMLSAQSYKLTSRFGQGKVVKIAYGVIASGSILLAFTGNAALSILLIAVISGCTAVLIPISNDIQNKSITVANRATILSAYAMIIDITSSAANLIIGKSANASVQASFMVCGAISIAALLLGASYFRAVEKSKAV